MRVLHCLLLAFLPAAAPVAAQQPVGNVVAGETISCDAITYQGTLPPKVAAELTPLHTLDGIAAVLKQRNIAFRRSHGLLSLDEIPAPTYASISRLPQGEPFIVPTPRGGTICVPLPSADSY